MDGRPRLQSANGGSRTDYSGVNSPSLASSGRASPFTGIKVKGVPSRPASPSLQRQQFTMKRPPSAARMHESNGRAPSPLVDSRRYMPPTDTRPSSSMSNRSAGTSSTALPKGAANTTVSIRIRPLQAESTHRPWLYEQQEDRISSNPGIFGPALDFSFDHVFKEAASNQTVYEESVRHLVKGVVEGYHGTVFAYGMTGTGKTFSMQGTSGDPGIIPQAVKDLFSLIARDVDNVYMLKVSYLEIYNERIRDLLNEASEDTEEIKIRDDPRRGLHAYPLVEVGIDSEQAFLAVMAKGDMLRHNAATDFNAHSSRSHAVIQIVLETSPRAVSKLTVPARVSTLNLIDLAGSEKAAADAERRKEGSYINKSLLTLGTVIAKLTSTNTSGSVAHIPFRDSKLTRLLQHALSGLSLVSILATINTGQAYVAETTNTLKFASRAKFIPGKAQKAELFGGSSAALIESLRIEVQSLRAQLAASQALVSKLQRSAGMVNIDSSMGEAQNGNQVSKLKDINENDSTLQYTPARWNAIEVIHQDRESLESNAQRTRSSSVTSPPGNFSYPSQFAQSQQQHIPEASTPSRYEEAQHEERSDRIKALADKEMASNVLTKSQRSREEARNLTIQIAQLKSREDKRALAGTLGGLGRMSPMYNNENASAPELAGGARGKKMTLISPSIRPPPREGFI